VFSWLFGTEKMLTGAGFTYKCEQGVSILRLKHGQRTPCVSRALKLCKNFWGYNRKSNCL